MPTIFPVLAIVTILAAPTLKFDAPSGWVSRTPASSMRVAEFALPHASKDTQDASLVLYYFGGQGGSVQANLDRWVAQMAQPDGSDSTAAARTSHLTTHGLPVTLVDVSGTYVAEKSPGSPEHYNQPGFRLIAAVVETPDGPFFVKVIGPAATVGRWESSVTTFLESLRIG